jgi:hypothetical protein
MLTARLADRPWALSCAACFFAALSFAMASVPALPLLATAKGASLPEIGFAVAAPLLIVAFLVRVPIIKSAEGWRATALVGAGATALLPLLFPLVTSPWQILVLRIAQGIALATIPLAVTTAAGALHDWHRGRLLALPSLAAWAIGPMAGGLLIDRFGLATTFAAAACCGILCLVSMAALPAVGRYDETPEYAPPATGSAAGPVALRLALGCLEAFLPLYALGLGLGARHVGLLFAICTVWAAVGTPLWRRLSVRTPAGTLVIGLMIAGMATSVVGLTGQFALHVLAMALLGAGAAAIYTAQRPAMAFDGARPLQEPLPPVLDSLAHGVGIVAAGLALPVLGASAVFQVTGILLAAAAFFVAAFTPHATLNTGRHPPA